jgi:hypothetical protein
MRVVEPDLDRETPDALDCSAIERALRERHGMDIEVEGRTGKNAAILCAMIPEKRKTIELFVLVSAPNAVEQAMDFIDATIPELKKGRTLPLDWEQRGAAIVRGETRDYEAEAEAAKLLGDQQRPRGIDGLAHRFE